MLVCQFCSCYIFQDIYTFCFIMKEITNIIKIVFFTSGLELFIKRIPATSYDFFFQNGVLFRSVLYEESFKLKHIIWAVYKNTSLNSAKLLALLMKHFFFNRQKIKMPMQERPRLFFTVSDHISKYGGGGGGNQNYTQHGVLLSISLIHSTKKIYLYTLTLS